MSQSSRFSRLTRRRFVAAAAVSALAANPRPWTVLAQTTATPPSSSGPWTDAGAIPGTLAADASPRFRAVAAALTAAMAANGIPGAALGIFANGQEEHAVFGVADIATMTPVTPDTLFQLASLTKPHTGTAIFRLIAEGKLDLDAPVHAYLPTLRLADADVAARVTLRHLLTHTGGWWGDDASDTGNGDDAIARFLAERLPTFPQLFPLGAFCSYNNTGFTVLGRLIEVATGMPYRQAMAELVLKPLGLTGTTFAREDVARRPHASGHVAGKHGPEAVTSPFLPRWDDPDGGLWSTTRGQLRFARFHLGDGTAPNGVRLLAPSTVELMRTPQVAIPGVPALSMGLPWFTHDVAGERLVLHTGDTDGQHAMLLFSPDRGFAIVLLTNAQPGGGIAETDVLDVALQQYLGLGLDAAHAGLTAALTVPAGTPTFAMAAEDLAQYTGRYRTPDSDYTVRAANDGLRLTFEEIALPDQLAPGHPAEPARDVPLPFVGPDLALLGTTILPFVRRPDGDIGWISIGLRLLPRSGAA